jgi:predicted CopG family antitoxin
MNKQHILQEIRRTAKENGDIPLGKQRFLAETGIRESDWIGRFWVKWSDAVREAGFEPQDSYSTYRIRVTLGSGIMQKKLAITLDEEVYNGLHKVVGRRRISRFIEDLVRPHVLAQDLEAAYQQMAQDEEREAEALEWAEATVSDVSDEPR